MRYLRLLAVIVFLVVLVTLPYPVQTRQAAAPAAPVAMATSKRFDVSTANAAEARLARAPQSVSTAMVKERGPAGRDHRPPEEIDR